MKTLTIQLRSFLGALCILLLTSTGAQAQEMTLQNLIDRAAIEDLITRFYYNFGGAPESFANAFTEDGLLLFGEGDGSENGPQLRGREAIAKFYDFSGGLPEGDEGAEGGMPAMPEFFSFNSIVGNPLVVVNGDTAAAQLIWSEHMKANASDPTQIVNQGRDYITLVKVKGEWLMKTRHVTVGTEPPKGWKNIGF